MNGKNIFNNNFVNAEAEGFLRNERKKADFYDMLYGSDNTSMLTSSKQNILSFFQNHTSVNQDILQSSFPEIKILITPHGFLVQGPLFFEKKVLLAA